MSNQTEMEHQPTTPTNRKGINIIGVEQFMPAKILSIIDYIAETFPGVIWTIAFMKALEPNKEEEELFSSFYYESRTMAINVTHHFENMLERVTGDTCDMRGDVFMWYNFLISLFHETKHGINFIKDGTKIYTLSKTEQDEACKEAQEWAMKQVHELAKRTDIEPPAIEDWGYLTENLQGLLDTVDSFANDKKPEKWAVAQAQMIKDGTIMTDDAVDIHTLRKYCELQVADDDPAWEIELTTIIKPEETSEPENKDGQTSLPLPPSESVIAYTDGPPPPPDSMEDNGIEISETTTIAAVLATPATAQELPPESINSSMNDLDKPIIGAATTTTMPGGHNLSGADMERCAYQVNKRLASLIFHKCHFQQGSYINVFGIVEWVPLTDIPNAQKLYHAMDCLNDKGELLINVPIWEDDPRLPNKPKGCIKGRTFANGKLPGYCLYLDVAGALHRRTILPQNPDKMNGQNLTTWAQKARNGHFILLVYRDLSETEKKSNTSGITIKMEAAPGKALEYLADPFDNTKRRVLTY